MRNPEVRRASNRRYAEQPHVRARKAERSREEAAADHAERLASTVLTCRQCGQPFRAKKRLSERYCGDACREVRAREDSREHHRMHGRDLSERPCKYCGKPFTPVPGGYRRALCSDRCAKRASKAGLSTHRKRARRAGVQYQPVNRLKVFERDGWRCQVCGKATPRRWLGTRRANAPELDHRVPMAKGGAHSYANVQCACRRCNLAKGAHRVVGQLPLMENPSP